MTVVSTEESTEIRQVSLDMIIMSRVSGCQSFYIRDGSTSCCNQIVTLEHNHAALDHQNLPSENFISEVVQSHVRSESWQLTYGSAPAEESTFSIHVNIIKVIYKISHVFNQREEQQVTQISGAAIEISRSLVFTDLCNSGKNCVIKHQEPLCLSQLGPILKTESYQKPELI